MRKESLPLLSDKFCEGLSTKYQWLVEHLLFRESHPGPVTFKHEARLFQSARGKNNSLLAERFRGAFLGLAIGDALGTTLEFKSRRESEEHTEITGKGIFNLKPGQWTDDTSMALCLAYSLLDKRGFDAGDQMRLYTLWWREGLFSCTGKCFDIGNTVADALAQFENTGSAYTGSTNERSAGNGSLMRLIPVVLFYASRYNEAITITNDADPINVIFDQLTKTYYGELG